MERLRIVDSSSDPLFLQIFMHLVTLFELYHKEMISVFDSGSFIRETYVKRR